MKKLKMTVNVAYNHQEADEFNCLFWKKAGVQARFSAAWLMVVDYLTKVRKHRGPFPRLRRSVQNIKRI